MIGVAGFHLRLEVTSPLGKHMARTIVMFDLDGTLADTMPQLVDALVERFRERLRDNGRTPRMQITDLLHMSPPQMIQAFIDISGLPASRIQAEFRSIAESLPTRLFAEVPAVLDALKELDCLIILSSTTPDIGIHGRLEAVGIANSCELAFGTNIYEGITKEDHPRVAAERLGISANGSLRRPSTLATCQATCGSRARLACSPSAA
jgi:phosphoglycolate phosphatase-like HAD superfamily hydrolase